MSVLFWPTILTLWALGTFWIMLVRYSLHDFSRSRLEEICTQKKNNDRFGEILKKQDQANIVMDVCFLLSIAFGFFVFSSTTFLHPIENATLSETVVWSIEILFCFLLTVFCFSTLPWSISRVAGEPNLYHSWTLIHCLSTLMKPLTSFSESTNKVIHRLVGHQEPSQIDSEAIVDELQSVIDEGQREGVLENVAGTMMYRVMEMAEQDTASVMTPRTDMDCIHVDSSLEETRQNIVEAGHSRMPIINESTDDIIGILYAKDLLKYPLTGSDKFSLRELVRQPLYVPETTGIDSLLETMKNERIHIAIVVDEYGGVAGMVCMEDILEEIVGEIDDEYDDKEESGINIVSPTTVELDPRLHLDDLNEQFKFGIPEEGDFDTLAGFILSKFNRIPRVNETYTWSHLHITILEVDKRKISKVRIERRQLRPEVSPEV